MAFRAIIASYFPGKQMVEITTPNGDTKTIDGIEEVNMRDRNVSVRLASSSPIHANYRPVSPKNELSVAVSSNGKAARIT